MTSLPILCWITAILILGIQASSAQIDAWSSHHFKGERGDVIGFRKMSPTDKSSPRPLVIFLHGAGVRGGDNIKQLVHGKDVLAKAATEYGAIVIAPQHPWTRAIGRE